MQKRKMYRIEQTRSMGLVNDVVVMAALSNGTDKYTSLVYMEAYVRSEMLKYPTLTDGIEVTISGNTLLIDKGTENLLCITEIEVCDLASEAPTVFTYAGTGIADHNNHELIN